jgi:hypothetical protein
MSDTTNELDQLYRPVFPADLIIDALNKNLDAPAVFIGERTMTAPVKPADIVTGDPAESQARLVHLLGQHATVLDDLTAKNRSQAERLETVDRMIPELRQSMAELRANIATASIPVGGPESELRQYVKPDGKIRLLGGASDGELWSPGLLDDGATHGEWHRRMKELVGMRSVARIARASGREGLDAAKVVSLAGNHVTNAAARIVHVAAIPRDHVHVEVRHRLSSHPVVDRATRDFKGFGQLRHRSGASQAGPQELAHSQNLVRRSDGFHALNKEGVVSAHNLTPHPWTSRSECQPRSCWLVQRQLLWVCSHAW